MPFDLLPARTDSAAANMATDFLLLQRYPRPAHARFRRYGWHRPAFTFGYGQKIAYVREQVATLVGDDPVELCRRPTGGGVVDHREDWTYALVIPRGHDLEAARAVESYRAIHTALRDSLLSLGQPAKLNDRCPADSDCADSPKGPTVCFIRPELHDVIHPDTGAKIAGAAQKRTKHGLLFQGSVWRPAAPAVADWDAFEAGFTARLATLLGLEAEATPWPDFNEGELEALTEQYATPEWIEYR